jgi:hypothetical protein
MAFVKFDTSSAADKALARSQHQPLSIGGVPVRLRRRGP